LRGIRTRDLGAFQLYNDEEERSRVMGHVLGGIAAGVLIGYPLGGVLFEFLGESAPFIVISFANGALLGETSLGVNVTKWEL
jgi:DHA1 family solute carrier family 18 vesicular amine transporter 1/2